MFWSEIEIRLLDKKNSWNKKLPLLSFAMDTGDGNILAGHFRGLPRSETLKKQYEEMVESDEDVVDGLYSEILDAIEGEEYEYDITERRLAEKLPKGHEIDLDNHYVRTFMENYTGTDESTIAAINILNAVTLTEEGSGPARFVKENGEELAGFFIFFMENLHTERLAHKMRRNWTEEPPRVLRIGLILLEEKQKEEENKLFADALARISGKRKRNAEKLAEYFLRDTKRARLVSILTERAATERVLLPGAEREEENRKAAYGMSAELFVTGGGAIFRTFVDDGQGEDDGYEIVNGFRVTGGKPECISVRELKMCIQAQPDGSIMEFPEDRYQAAFIRFE